MQYASHSGPKPIAATPFGYVVSGVLVALSVMAVAGSTVTVQWVAGSTVFVTVALLSAAVAGVLGAITRLPPAPAFLASVLALPFIVGFLVAPQAHAFYSSSHMSVQLVLQRCHW